MDENKNGSDGGRITSSRRKFLQGGALLAAPVAAPACAAALAGGSRDRDALEGRLARLEDEAALRQLHAAWLRRVNAGERGLLPDAAVRRLIADQAGAVERIEFAADGQSATGHFDHAVELETALPGDGTLAGTLVRMARVQGHGTARRMERRRLTVDYRKAAGIWQIGKVTLA